VLIRAHPWLKAKQPKDSSLKTHHSPTSITSVVSKKAEQIRDHSRNSWTKKPPPPPTLQHSTTSAPVLAHNLRPSTFNLTLAPARMTQRGLLDWHNRDYPYGYEWTSQSGVWSGMNRLDVEDMGIQANSFTMLRLKLDDLHPHSQKKPRAVTKVTGGLPQDGWLGIVSNRSFDTSFNIQVFLINRWGQRWTIDEQLNANPHLIGHEKWLKLSDFDPTYFGNIIPGSALNLGDVVEIQLHPHGLENLNHPVEIGLSVMRPELNAE
jgi:hypothetical protein